MFLYGTSRTGSYKPSIHDAPTSFSSPQLDAQGPPGSHLMETVEPQDGICTPDSRLGGGRPAIGNTHFGLYVRKEQTSAALEPQYTFDVFSTAASVTLPDTALPGTALYTQRVLGAGRLAASEQLEPHWLQTRTAGAAQVLRAQFGASTCKLSCTESTDSRGCSS